MTSNLDMLQVATSIIFAVAIIALPFVFDATHTGNGNTPSERLLTESDFSVTPSYDSNPYGSVWEWTDTEYINGGEIPNGI